MKIAVLINSENFIKFTFDSIFFIFNEYYILDLLKITDDYEMKFIICTILNELTIHRAIQDEIISNDKHKQKLRDLFNYLNLFFSTNKFNVMNVNNMFLENPISIDPILYFNNNKLIIENKGLDLNNSDNYIDLLLLYNKLNKISNTHNFIKEIKLEVQLIFGIDHNYFEIEIIEELKLIFLFFKKLIKETLNPNFFEYFYLFTLQAYEYQTKKISLWNFCPEIIPKNTCKFQLNKLLLNIALYIDFFELDLLFNFLILLRQRKYYDIFTEADYKNTNKFGKFEEKIINYLNNDKNCEINYENKKIRNFELLTFSTLMDFIESFEEFLNTSYRYNLLKIVKMDFLMEIIVRYYEFHFKNILNPLFNSESINLFYKNPIHFSFFVDKLVIRKVYLENSLKQKLFSIVLKIIIEVIDNLENEKSENLINTHLLIKSFDNLIKSLGNDEGYGIKDLIKSLFSKSKFSLLENLIFKQSNIIALALYYKIVTKYYESKKSTIEFNNYIIENKLFEYYLNLVEHVMKVMKCSKFELGTFFIRILQTLVNNQNSEIKQKYNQILLENLLFNKLNHANSPDKVFYPNSNEIDNSNFISLFSDFHCNIMPFIKNGENLFLSLAKSESIDQFNIVFNIFNSALNMLLNETITFTTLILDFKKTSISSKVFDIIFDILTSLYNPISSNIIKNDVSLYGDVSLSLNLTKSNNFLIFVSNNELVNASKICTLMVIELMEKEFNEEFNNEEIDIINSIYTIGFNIHVKNNMKNQEKIKNDFIIYKNYKRLEFLMCLIKKMNKRNKNLNYDIWPFYNKILPYFFKLLQYLSKDFVKQNNLKITDLGNNRVFRNNRFYKTIYLFIKGITYWRDLSIDMTNLRYNVINKIFSQVIQIYYDFLNKSYDNLYSLLEFIHVNKIAYYIINMTKSLNEFKEERSEFILLKQDFDNKILFLISGIDKFSELYSKYDAYKSAIKFILDEIYFKTYFVSFFFCDLENMTRNNLMKVDPKILNEIINSKNIEILFKKMFKLDSKFFPDFNRNKSRDNQILKSIFIEIYENLNSKLTKKEEKQGMVNDFNSIIKKISSIVIYYNYFKCDREQSSMIYVNDTLIQILIQFYYEKINKNEIIKTAIKYLYFEIFQINIYNNEDNDLIAYLKLLKVKIHKKSINLSLNIFGHDLIKILTDLYIKDIDKKLFFKHLNISQNNISEFIKFYSDQIKKILNYKINETMKEQFFKNHYNSFLLFSNYIIVNFTDENLLNMIIHVLHEFLNFFTIKTFPYFEPELEEICDAISIIGYLSFKYLNLRSLIIEMNFLDVLANIIIKKKMNLHYLVIFVKFIEILIFDESFVKYVVQNNILDLFYIDSEQKLKEFLEFDKISENLKSLHNLFNQHLKNELLNMCDFELNINNKTNLMILKKKYLNDPENLIFEFESKFKIILFDQICQILFKKYLENLYEIIETKQKLYYVNSDVFLRIITIICYKYPYFWEYLMNYKIIIEKNQITTYFNIEESVIMFKDFFVKYIIGFGFGYYTTLIDDNEIINKMKIGYFQLDDLILPKNRKYQLEILKSTNLLLFKMRNWSFKEANNLVILYNLSNFIVNFYESLYKKLNFCKTFENILKNTIINLSEIIKITNDMNYIRITDIEYKLANLYKFHLIILTKNKAKLLNIKLNSENFIPSIKYSFQKNLFQNQNNNIKENIKENFNEINEFKKKIEIIQIEKIEMKKNKGEISNKNIFLIPFLLDRNQIKNIKYNHYFELNQKIIKKIKKNHPILNIFVQCDKINIYSLLSNDNTKYIKKYKALEEFLKSSNSDSIKNYDVKFLFIALDNLKLLNNINGIPMNLYEFETFNNFIKSFFFLKTNEEINIKTLAVNQPPPLIEKFLTDEKLLIKNESNIKNQCLNIEEIKKNDIAEENEEKIDKTIQFLEKYPLFLGLDKKELDKLNKSEKITLLQEKYKKYLLELTIKHNCNSDSALKLERERLSLLNAENYLNNSSEEQYMFQEILELKFLLSSLKKNNINIEKESFEAQEIEKQSLEIDNIELDSIYYYESIQFNLNHYPKKNIFINYENELKKKQKEKKIPYNNELEPLFDYNFFFDTISFDEDFFIKIFQNLLSELHSSNFFNHFKQFDSFDNKYFLKSTFFLLKSISFNYRNLKQILKLFDYLFNEVNYFKQDFEFLIKFNENIEIKDKDIYYTSAFTNLFIFIILFIEKNYFGHILLIDNQNLIRNLNNIQIENNKIECNLNLKNFFNNIFQIYSNDKSKLRKKTKIISKKCLYLLLKSIFSKNLDSINFKNDLKANQDEFLFYPFFSLEENSNLNIPEYITKLDFLLNNKYLILGNIEKTDYYFKILSKNNKNIFEILESNIYQRSFEKLNENLKQIQEKYLLLKQELINISKFKKIDYTVLISYLNNFNNNFNNHFPQLTINIVTISQILNNTIILIKFFLQNLIKRINEDNFNLPIIEQSEIYNKIEKEILDDLKYFLYKNKNFLFVYLNLIKIFSSLKDLQKLVPTLRYEQKINIFESLRKYQPLIKSFLKLVSFFDGKNKTKNDLENFQGNEYLPVLSKINTIEISSHDNEYFLEKSLSATLKMEEITFEDIFELLYQFQDVIRYFIMIKPSGESLKEYQIIFDKAPDLKQIDLFLKSEYIRKEAHYRSIKKVGNTNYDFSSEEGFFINRKKVFDSTYKIFKDIDPKHWMQIEFKVQFEDEPGIDAGGLTREWINLLSKEIFNPNFGLFTLSSNQISVQPSPLSFIVPGHMHYFKFIGNLIARICLESDSTFGVTFTKSFLKLLLNKHLYINDIEDIDSQLCKTMNWMLSTDINDLDLDQTFNYCVSFFGKLINIDLKKNGKDICVTEQNKKEYIKEFCYSKMIKEIKAQTHTIMMGILEVIPIDLIKILDEREFGILLSGLSEINVDELRETTILTNYTKESEIIIWLWEIIDEYNQIQRASFYYFMTGLFRLPYGGLKSKPISITKIDNLNRLPIAHTCSRNIELPNYTSKEILKTKLEFAIFDGVSGFEIG